MTTTTCFESNESNFVNNQKRALKRQANSCNHSRTNSYSSSCSSTNSHTMEDQDLTPLCGLYQNDYNENDYWSDDLEENLFSPIYYDSSKIKLRKTPFLNKNVCLDEKKILFVDNVQNCVIEIPENHSSNPPSILTRFFKHPERICSHQTLVSLLFILTMVGELFDPHYSSFIAIQAVLATLLGIFAIYRRNQTLVTIHSVWISAITSFMLLQFVFYIVFDFAQAVHDYQLSTGDLLHLWRFGSSLTLIFLVFLESIKASKELSIVDTLRNALNNKTKN
ncbi:predicted protein [Naegleria gruberi]|uniref:Predicted protein n=1 Tax=Naegleria gruberi TaxID=5762 RepID=D2V305_NAEGR|nr:uncharacterized protein NAEGRDRAFT_63181 [Naegleria gruberi]EFC48545.1 predicted protein [Naegleria gruberi]|eukprot:XP_002681289.1 predicted protein [Naegleria gruberi strain NEG-M]